METILRNSGKALQRRFRRTVLLAGLLLIMALLAFSAVLLSSRQDAMLADIRSDSQQLRLSLEDTIDVVRAHLFTMQHSVEYNLEQPAAPDAALAKGQRSAPDSIADMRPDLGSLHVDPKAGLDPQTFWRDLLAAASFLPDTAAMHQWNKMFQWSYYYDKDARWVLIYPQLPQEEVLRIAQTSDMSMAVKKLIDADGTQPVTMVNPQNNPQRNMLWTPAYHDSAGKGLMVTLLAPVYRDQEYTGAVGTDVTLKELNRTLREHAPAFVRSLIIDSTGNVLADTGSAQNENDSLVRLSEAFPQLTNGLASVVPEDTSWLRYPLKGTEWTLLIHVPQSGLRLIALKEMLPRLGIALLLVAALFALGWLQSRRYSWPALQLAEYVERCERSADAEIPDVPESWHPIFEQVASGASERKARLNRTQSQAEELERKVAERTAELQSANDSLAASVASLHKTREDLLRADRLGALGGMIAGVANELQGPLEQAQQTADTLVAGLETFRTQQARGLLKAELDAFVAQADKVGRQVGSDLGAVTDLLGRFKQLALDQASEDSRRFVLRDVAENVLAVMRPALALQSCEASNQIPGTIEMQAKAGVMGQILHHVLADAIERIAASGGSGRIELTAGEESGERGAQVVLTIRDNGAPTAGQQAGLAIAQALAQESLGGIIEAKPTKEGSQVTIRLPAATE